MNKDDKPRLTDDSTTITIHETWVAPNKTETGTYTAAYAKIRVNNLPIVTISEGAAGSRNIVYVGQTINAAYNMTAFDHLGKIEREEILNANAVLNVTHHDKYITAEATNSCGTQSAQILCNMNGRSASYYAACDRDNVKLKIRDHDGAAVIAVVGNDRLLVYRSNQSESACQNRGADDATLNSTVCKFCTLYGYDNVIVGKAKVNIGYDWRVKRWSCTGDATRGDGSDNVRYGTKVAALLLY